MAILKVRKADGSIQEIQAIVGPRGAQGNKGDKGDKGDTGSDAQVTSENIASALGYTPADAADVSAQAAVIAQKADRADIDGTERDLDFTMESGTINNSGSNNDSSLYTDTNIRSKGYVELVRNVDINTSIPEDTNLKMWFFDADKALISYSTNCGETVTPAEGTKYIRFRVQASENIETTADVRMYQQTIAGDVDALRQSVSSQSADIAELRNTTETPVASGKVWTTTADGAEWADPTGGGGTATDVQIGGTSITQDGVANIPYAQAGGTDAQAGVVAFPSNLYYIDSNHRLQYNPASETEIAGRSVKKVIVPSNLVTAVNSVLCSTTASEALTTTEQAAARKRIGIGDWELIDTVEFEGTTSECIRRSEPDGTPYNFKCIQIFFSIPANTMTATNKLYMYIYPQSNQDTVKRAWLSFSTTANSAHMWVINCECFANRILHITDNQHSTETANNFYTSNEDIAIKYIYFKDATGAIPIGVTASIYAIRA